VPWATAIPRGRHCPDAGGVGGGGLVIAVHVTSEAEGVFGVIVGLLVIVSQRFVPEIVQVIREGRVLGRDHATTKGRIRIHFPEVGG